MTKVILRKGSGQSLACHSQLASSIQELSIGCAVRRGRRVFIPFGSEDHRAVIHRWAVLLPDCLFELIEGDTYGIMPHLRPVRQIDPDGVV